MRALEQAIWDIQSEADFNAVALEIFAYQAANNRVYGEFLSHLSGSKPTHYTEIPRLPISFFKTHEVVSGSRLPTVVFQSSGTTGMVRSKHALVSEELYRESFRRTYRMQMGNPEDQVILALLPHYVEQGASSLVYMVDDLIRLSGHPLSGFYLGSFDELLDAYRLVECSDRKIVLFGVSYALLDLAERRPNLARATIIETGGMKGRRKELSKEELHARLIDAFQVDFISSEYGMTELLSQAYSDRAGLFSLPPWMRVAIRETNDPFALAPVGNTGGVDVFDLANLYSCAFIATQDLGRWEDGQLRLMGRFDHADIRGCNLLVG